MRKFGLSFIAIFVVWTVVDMLIHGNFLMEAYGQLSHLWRPEEDFKFGLMYLSSALVLASFIFGYCRLVSPKSTCAGLIYGLVMGAIVGIGMGLGTYTYMPITCFIATTWTLSELAKYALGGLILSYFYGE